MTADLEPLLGQAVANVLRDYPIHWTQTIDSPGQLRAHRELHPMFGGSWDWHSCVHQTWSIVRLLRRLPGSPGERDAMEALDRLLTPANGLIEASFFGHPHGGGWERPYGWAWLLLLDAELQAWASPAARRWAASLAPLRAVLEHDWITWITSAARPVRAGLHANTAFAAGLGLDAARSRGEGELSAATSAAGLRFFASDERYGAYEPDAADFLSPALVEADLLRRILAQEEFTRWFDRFLPDLDGARWTVLREPVAVEQGSDPQGAHLIGLNLSRAWCWRGIAGALLPDHRFAALARAAAAAHRAAGWRSVFGEGYAATHWVGSFAVYLDLGALAS
ncbi:MAG: DUF2891 domain-containing protein [Candidatus Dormibacteraceae bacterium]